MGKNRTTVKSAVITKNVPTITNAILNDILNNELADNLRFRLDDVASQTAGAPSVPINFTGYDKFILNGTGLNLVINCSGLEDGDEKWLFVNKSPGRTCTFYYGHNDLTPVADYITSASQILYQIQRKGSINYVMPWLNTIRQATDTIIGLSRRATDAENDALSNLEVYCTPGRLPISSSTQKGLIETASSAETISGGSGTLAVTPAGLTAKLADWDDLPAWQTLTLQPGWTGTIEAYKDKFRNVHVRANQLKRTGASLFGNTGQHVGALPTEFLPDGIKSEWVISSFTPVSFNRYQHIVYVGTGGVGLGIIAEPHDYPANNVTNFYIVYRSLN